jgi:hypothetical protein
VGAFADALPKGKVMFISNAIKVGLPDDAVRPPPAAGLCRGGSGRGRLLAGQVRHPDRAAAALQLVKANGWIEGLTITSIILGVLLGGQLVGPAVAAHLMALDVPFVDNAAEAAIGVLVFVYALAAAFNLRIPHRTPLVPMRRTRRLLAATLALLPDFWTATAAWRDKLGQISLSTTTLFWGVSGNLRYIVLAWAAVALGYSTTQASALVGVVAIGTAAGAVLASMRMRLDHATG